MRLWNVDVQNLPISIPNSFPWMQEKFVYEKSFITKPNPTHFLINHKHPFSKKYFENIKKKYFNILL